MIDEKFIFVRIDFTRMIDRLRVNTKLIFLLFLFDFNEPPLKCGLLKKEYIKSHRYIHNYLRHPHIFAEMHTL